MRTPRTSCYDVILVSVANSTFRKMSEHDYRALLKPTGGIIYDLKYVLKAEEVDIRL